MDGKPPLLKGIKNSKSREKPQFISGQGNIDMMYLSHDASSESLTTKYNSKRDRSLSKNRGQQDAQLNKTSSIKGTKKTIPLNPKRIFSSKSTSKKQSISGKQPDTPSANRSQYGTQSSI